MRVEQTKHLPIECLYGTIIIYSVGLGVSHKAALSSRCLRYSPNDDSRTRTHNPLSHHRNDTYQDGCATKWALPSICIFTYDMHILFCLHDFFYKCKPFKVINPVIICRGDWIRHLVALEEGGGGTEYWLSSANELTAESQSWGEWAAQGTVLQGSLKNLDNSAAKQQISWVVSLWRLPLTFVWPGVPKDCWLGLIGAPSDGDWNAIWWYFVSMRLYLAMLLYVSISKSILLPQH